MSVAIRFSSRSLKPQRSVRTAHYIRYRILPVGVATPFFRTDASFDLLAAFLCRHRRKSARASAVRRGCVNHVRYIRK